MDQYWQQKHVSSRYAVAQVVLGEHCLRSIRRELRAMGAKIAETDLAALLQSEVIKRDVLEGENAVAAAKLVRKLARRRVRAKEAAADDVDSDGASPSKTVPAQPK
jgi:predicted regulator of amino acid metabolism with ACT domain